MVLLKKLFIFSIITGSLAAAVSAQETQTKVVDEVVAQVNDSVITLSRVKREMKDIIDADVQKGRNRDEATKYVDEKQGELIANLINEELVVQKAKEIGLDRDIEALINQRILDLMKQNNFKTVEAVYAEMEKGGINPEDFKNAMRKQLTRERVIQQDLQSRIYWGFTSKELKDYYEKHKEKFTRPEMVSVSEIFLSFAGRDEKAVREKADQLYAQLKAGGDFGKLAKENDAGVVTQGAGKVDDLHVRDISPVLAKPLTGVPIGGFTVPFQAEELGMVILRVDNRRAASSESIFDENAVRMALMNERFADEQKKYFAKLRSEAYIKLGEAYRPLVSPILFADERKGKDN